MEYSLKESEPHAKEEGIVKIRKLHIENFRSLRDIKIRVTDVAALVGRNNSGKSNLLKALEIFFNPSVKYISEGSFYNHDTDQTIRIVAEFGDLSDLEQEKFAPWIDQNKLRVGYEVSCIGGDTFNIDIVAHVTVPEPEWLQQSEISGKNIDRWWPARDELEVAGHHFGERLGTSKPLVGDWEGHAREFCEEFRDDIPWIARKLKNPKGAKNVLKGSLPEFIYVPAVRDVTEETKVTQTSPFGQLVHSVLNEISEERKERISAELSRVAQLLNREGEVERVEELQNVEDRLNGLMGELMDCDIEIEMAMPKLEEVFGEAQIYADDGVRTPIEHKGHGMQRAMILTILRHYAELAGKRKAGERADERSTIIAVEEPELYLHPQSQRTLMSVFRDIASGRDQVFCTTHSSLFVDIGYFDEVCRFRRVDGEEGMETEVSQLTIDMMLEDLRQRKEVEGTSEGIRSQYKNAFDALVNEGFFADKVLLVEGPSEHNLIRLVGEAMDYSFDRENIAVVHCNGKGQIDRLLRVFTGFKLPTYVWFDGDKLNDDEEVRRKSLELLELMGEPLEEIGELETRVEDRYAVLETTLEDLLSEELGDYDAIIADAVDQYGPCGKPLKAKFIGQVLAERIRENDDLDQCPGFLRGIVEQVQDLEGVSAVLHPEAEKLRP